MSKAIIIKHIGRAKYRVAIQTDIRILKERIKILEKQIEKSNILIAYDLQNAVDNALAELQSIPVPIGPIEDSQYFAELSSRILPAREKYDKSLEALNKEKIVREDARVERGKLVPYEAEREMDVWCADYSVNLKEGDAVGLIDFYQYRGKQTVGDPVIVPGYITGQENVYNPVRDGVNIPVVALSTMQWWYAMGMVSGLERFNPHYHKATITAVNGEGTVNVAVDAIYTQLLRSEAHAMPGDEVNLTKVPVRYLTCNAGAFSVDDRVIIEYPRKNIHAGLIEEYRGVIAGLGAKVIEYNAKKVSIASSIAGKKSEIAGLESEIALKIIELNAIDPAVNTAAYKLAEFQLQTLTENKEQAGRSLNGLMIDSVTIDAQIVDMDIKINKLYISIAREEGNSIALEAYTKTRPKEITVIGFVEKPKACTGIAYQDKNSAWRLIKADGRDIPLSTPPPIIGDVNMGKPNKDGEYDRPCMWNSTSYRFRGNTYGIGAGYTIHAMGVIRDAPYEGMDTVNFLLTNDAGGTGKAEQRTIVFDKNGSSITSTTFQITMQDSSLNEDTNQLLRLHFASETTYIGPNSVVRAETVTKGLIDKGGKFAIVITVQDFDAYDMGLNQHLGPPRGGMCYIWYVDLEAHSRRLINEFYYVTDFDVVPDNKTNVIQYNNLDGSIRGFEQRFGAVKCELDCIFYDSDGDIGSIAMANVKHYGGVWDKDFSGIYNRISFKNGVMSVKKQLYESRYNHQVSGSTTALLTTVVANEAVLPIRIQLNTLGFSGDAGSSGSAKIITPSQDVFIRNAAAEPAGNRDFTQIFTRMQLAGEVSEASVRSFSAGCLKVRYDKPPTGYDNRTTWTANMWLEYRGESARLVMAPSTNYTAII
jgi:hypothetical protein